MIIHLDSLLHYEMKLNKENNKIELYVLPEDAILIFRLLEIIAIGSVLLILVPN